MITTFLFRLHCYNLVTLLEVKHSRWYTGRIVLRSKLEDVSNQRDEASDPGS